NDVSSGDQGVPGIALAPNGTLYVVWMDQRTDEGDIYSSLSLDGGRTFSESVKINDDSGSTEQRFPSIAVSNSGKIHVVWEDWRNDLDGEYISGGGTDGKNIADIYYATSSDGGISWTPNQKISGDLWESYKYLPRISIDAGDIVHIVWADPWISGLSAVYYVNSTDGGTTFSEPRIISDPSYSARYPDLTLDELGNVFVLWKDERNGTSVRFTRSLDGGQSFETDQRISDRVLTKDLPRISEGGGLLGVLWISDEGLRFSSSDDKGASFASSSRVDEITSWIEICPSLSVSEQRRVYVAWTDKRSGDEDIYFAYSINEGLIFGADQRVNDDTTSLFQRRPSVVVGMDEEVYVVWQDERSGTDWDIYMTSSTLQLPDLTVVSSEVDFNPPSPVLYGTNVLINATVHNVGEKNATDIVVRFYDTVISPSNLINEAMIPRIQKGGLSWAEAQWTATTPQFHDICIVLDPENNITESNETNNTACKQIEVIVPPIPAPPGNLTARLSGEDFSNTTLKWSLSPDDDGGSINVTRYDIYRNQSYDAMGRGYLLIGSVPNGTSEYVDENAGEGDPSNHFYYVCAIGDMNVSSCSVDQAGKFTRPLTPGPNLISVPLIQSNESIETVLQTVEYEKAWFYDSSSQEWKWYMKSKTYRRGLWNVNHTMGLWINVTQDSNLTLAGIVPAQTTIHLYEGWNIVSFPSWNASFTVADLKASVPVERVEGFDPAPSHFLRVLSDSDVLLAGRAYWVKVQADVEWIITFE
ncbi:MAG: CARDB domain-containing protein, partial [Thermoplasmata archaeon]